jgi:hypothetical protein
MTSNSGKHPPSEKEVKEMIAHICKQTKCNDDQLTQIQVLPHEESHGSS